MPHHDPFPTITWFIISVYVLVELLVFITEQLDRRIRRLIRILRRRPAEPPLLRLRLYRCARCGRLLTHSPERSGNYCIFRCGACGFRNIILLFNGHLPPAT